MIENANPLQRHESQGEKNVIYRYRLWSIPNFRRIDSRRPERAFGKRAERFDMLQRHDETDSQHALFLLAESQIEWARGQNEH